MEIRTSFPDEHLNEAINRFVGYWATDYEICNNIAKRYCYSEKEFSKEVYRKLNNNFKITE